MTQYRAHFVTHGDRIFVTQNFLAESDGDAIDHARHHYRSGIGKGYEIWDGDRYIHTEVYPPTQW